MDTEISSCLTYKWRVRINQDGLYNKKEGAPRGGWEKWPKTRASQPTSRRKTPGVKENLTLYEHHEKPTACRSRPSLPNPRSTNDIVRGLFTCEPDTVTVRHESRPYNWRRLWERLVCWYRKWVDRVSSLYLTVGYRVLV